MIGSIGADNRYSTKYNNLKSNRESDKWVGTLTQTVDKNTSSRADVNRAKKSKRSAITKNKNGISRPSLIEKGFNFALTFLGEAWCCLCSNLTPTFSLLALAPDV